MTFERTHTWRQHCVKWKELSRGNEPAPGSDASLLVSCVVASIQPLCAAVFLVVGDNNQLIVWIADKVGHNITLAYINSFTSHLVQGHLRVHLAPNSNLLVLSAEKFLVFDHPACVFFKLEWGLKRHFQMLQLKFSIRSFPISAYCLYQSSGHRIKSIAPGGKVQEVE